MAKKSASPATLTFRDLVLGADAPTLRQALEARLRIDELIAERQAAYERIATLETQVEEVIGEPGVFPFPPPPLPVAGLDPKSDGLVRGPAPAPMSAKRPATRTPVPPSEPDDATVDEDDSAHDTRAEAEDDDSPNV